MSRRQEDLRMKGGPYGVSSDRRIDLDDEQQYLMSRRAAREELLLRSSGRSLSPQHVMEGTRRMVIMRDRRSTSLARRRDYAQHVDRVHGDQVLSRSPPIERTPRRSHMDDRASNMSRTSLEMRRKIEYHEYSDYDDFNGRSKHSYGYDNHVEVYNPKDYSARRSAAGGRDALDNPIPVEDAMERDTRFLQNYKYATKYGEACTYEKKFAEASGNYSTVDMRRGKDESIRYQDAIPHEKLVKDVYYKDGENSVSYRREGPYVGPSLSKIKDFETEPLPKDTSSDMILRGEYFSNVWHVQTLPSDGYSKCYGKVVEPLVADGYSQRTLSDNRRGYEEGCRDSKCYACDAYTSARPEHTDYLYPETGLSGNDDPDFSHHGNLYAKVAYDRGEYDQRDFLRPDDMDITVESMGKAECSHSSRRIIKNNRVRDLDVARKEMAPEFLDSRRSSAALMQGEDYLDSEHPRVQLIRKVSDHDHISDYDCIHEHDIEECNLGNGYGRYALAGSDRTRLKDSSDSKNDVEFQRLAGVSERMNDDRLVNNERILKRKYINDEGLSRVDTRSVVRSKYNMSTRGDDFYDHQTDFTSRKSSGVHQKRASGYEQNHYYAEAEPLFDETYHLKDSTKAGLTSYEEQSESIGEHSGKHFKIESRHSKGYTKSESSKSYSHLHHTNQRSNYYRQHNLRPGNNDEQHMVVAPQAADLPKNSGGSWKCEPSEDSEGFKQRVQAAYLDFSKRFNENPTARKLYKEEGKAGSLFCVVCRRSASKEFQDTRALATHAFMSHKAGLRPQHLGLHKSICVLMGWNIMPDSDSGIWAPEMLPRAEALAQKEDLILWPPAVIIHNISLSYNDHNEWKLINIDALGEFLRVKGFHLGKMKICLGNPGDHSVILVKFLGTFSGLQEAERLHKYFSERKHGRVDFEEAISSIGKHSKPVQGDNEVDKLEDVLLYGYVGISEDLDRVDFDTKKRSSVKSKKEIHEIADAPVKPK